MAHRLLIQSRRGNYVFGLVGAMYVLGALMLFGVLLYSSRALQSFTEIGIEVVLVSCAVAGIWFAINSARNLRSH